MKKRRFAGQDGADAETLASAGETKVGADNNQAETLATETQIQSEVDEAENEPIPGEAKELGATYRRRLASQVAHFGTSSLLGTYSQKRGGSPHPFEVSVIHVQTRKGQLFKDGHDKIMTKIFPDEKERQLAATAIREVSKGMAESTIGLDFQSIFYHKGRKIPYGATTHCEIGLVGLLKYF